ncbi:Uncharacterised protein [uncultured archaeon]|nr:Uncharacterised protein [uncultured archaeon]
MVFDARMLALANLIIKVLLIIVVSGAVYHAKKKNLGIHCTIVRSAVLVQIAAIAGVMLPSLLGYMKITNTGLIYIEMLSHHTIGLAVIALWVYINLIYLGIVNTRIKIVTLMRLALLLWILGLLLGLRMYMQIYL